MDLAHITTAQLELEQLKRAFHRTFAAQVRARETYEALGAKLMRQIAEHGRQSRRLAASVPPVPKVP